MRRSLTILVALLAALIAPATAEAIGNTSPPVVTGSTVQGQTLTTSNGSWTPTPASYSYKWRRCAGGTCTTISGATSQTYVLQAADVGEKIGTNVTACTSGGSCSNALSATVGPATASGGGGTGGYQSVLFWLGWDGSTLTAVPSGSATQVDLFALQSTVAGESGAITWPTGCTLGQCLDYELLGGGGNGNVDPAMFVSQAHGMGAKAIITIGGISNPDWHGACRSANVSQFAANVASYMHTFGFDGVDLDLEQDPGSPTDPSFTTAELNACTTDLAADVHADGGVLTSDVDQTTDLDIPQDQKADGVDQFNAMGYQGTASGTESSISNLTSAPVSVPANKITIGVDLLDFPAMQSHCGDLASWAKANGLLGSMVWFGQQDEGDTPSWGCLNAIKPYVG